IDSYSKYIYQEEDIYVEIKALSYNIYTVEEYLKKIDRLDLIDQIDVLFKSRYKFVFNIQYPDELDKKILNKFELYLHEKKNDNDEKIYISKNVLFKILDEYMPKDQKHIYDELLHN